MKITVTHIGTATTLLEIGGLLLLTDPAFDPAPAEYRRGPVVLRSTAGPVLSPTELPSFDAVLLSHDEHPDNLDATGRALLADHPVFTTVSGAGRLGGQAVGLAPWETRTLTVGEHSLRITGTPCQHGPVGDVTGYVIEVPGEEEAVYVSGDTVYFPELDEIGRRFTIGTAVLHLGAARVTGFGDDLITMDGAQAAALTRSLGARRVVPVHYTSWEHFTEGRAEVDARFAEAGLADRLHWLTPGLPELVGGDTVRPVSS
ncbi:L-ascorbate metabolism protein UlaG (beta-lactamase superfamily) [Kitasatospora gansuensis]|uniref:L-ascorbate metabolism protein UlaG (Beta-lactamase superfamily) n=1 Tax=Kitasatospora gansuensis TaxID=258050 RepID=A0A7W7S7A1_9ACTN|nr:MBL fold metallo-hydrolase [Kitasatospora gansuensis]MBB4945159.1 L-ascorbate metabolism protein UlaG (beta-lactamase superfamily) [Kitasatospora gansuensis]